ncbi:MAG TPA: hypothetical protein VFT64_05825 [Rickettsiales bacterium]|nr:hypothetical protein [Rickettsiales bacterium]
MKKQHAIKQELHDFLKHHCETKLLATGNSDHKHMTYIYHTKDCTVFMAEAYVQGVRNAIGQTEEVMMEAKKTGDFGNVIMAYNWSVPEPGLDVIQIPESLVEQLNQEQAAILLRNLQRIQKDIEEGRSRREALQNLFGKEAQVVSSYALDGSRQFFIRGVKSVNDRRSYGERYAEQAATNVLFDLPKALNAAIQVFLPEYERGELFIEGISHFNKKMRYGAEAHTELLISDDGAAVFTKMLREASGSALEIAKIFQQAMLDPVGLSLKYYLGKHALVKLPFKEGES